MHTEKALWSSDGTLSYSSPGSMFSSEHICWMISSACPIQEIHSLKQVAVYSSDLLVQWMVCVVTDSIGGTCSADSLIRCGRHIHSARGNSLVWDGCNTPKPLYTRNSLFWDGCHNLWLHGKFLARGYLASSNCSFPDSIAHITTGVLSVRLHVLLPLQC